LKSLKIRNREKEPFTPATGVQIPLGTPSFYHNNGIIGEVHDPVYFFTASKPGVFFQKFFFILFQSFKIPIEKEPGRQHQNRFRSLSAVDALKPAESSTAQPFSNLLLSKSIYLYILGFC
jgi:hypothetical protein